MVKELERVRRICFSLPEVSEKMAWGSNTFRVNDKMIAMFENNHHGSGRIALWCHAKKEIQEKLLESDTEKLFKPPYMGPKGWIGIHLDKVTDEEILDFVKEAYRNVAPKKMLKLLD
jgi:hypothetical protein